MCIELFLLHRLLVYINVIPFFSSVRAFKLKHGKSLPALSECVSLLSVLLLEKLLFWTLPGLGLCAGTLGFA